MGSYFGGGLSGWRGRRDPHVISSRVFRRIHRVVGVAQEIVGVGYRAEATAKGLTLSLGYSHQIHYEPAGGVKLECPNQTTVVISGIDKQKVGQAAAEIRAFRPPEPYKGKGVRYQGEHVRRKAGKTAGA